MALARPSRRQGRGQGTGSQSLAPPSACSAIRRRTSTAVGAGYSSLPGRQPAAIFSGPGPSSAQTWQVLARKANPPSRAGCSPPPFSALEGGRRGRALHDDGAQGAGEEFRGGCSRARGPGTAGRRCCNPASPTSRSGRGSSPQCRCIRRAGTSSSLPRRRQWSDRRGERRGRAPSRAGRGGRGCPRPRAARHAGSRSPRNSRCAGTPPWRSSAGGPGPRRNLAADAARRMRATVQARGDCAAPAPGGANATSLKPCRMGASRFHPMRVTEAVRRCRRQ